MSLQIMFVLLFTAFGAASSIVTKATLNKKANTYAFTFVHNLAGSLVVLPLIFFDHRMPSEILPWLFLLFGTACSIAGDYYYFKSMALEDVSILTLVFRFRLVLVFLLGAFFYKEDITCLKILAMILITAGPLIIGYEKSRFRLSKGIVLAILSNIFLAMLFVVDKTVSDGVSVPLYNFINFFTSALFFLFLYNRNSVRAPRLHMDVPIVTASIAGILLSLAALCRRYSYHFGEISIATPLLNLSVVLTLILGIVILKERKKLLQKAVGGALVIAGAIVLGM